MRIVGYLATGKRRACDKAIKHVTQQLGGTIRDRDDPVDCDLAIGWAWKPKPWHLDAREKGTPMLILEQTVWSTPGLGKGDYFTVAYNGLQGGGWIPETPRTPRTKPEMQPWRSETDGQVTLIGQVPGDAALRGLDMPEWLDKVSMMLKMVYPDREVHTRPHPFCLPSWHWDDNEGLQSCFDKTGLCVTHTSTVGAEAVIQGIPTVVGHYGSLAYEVATHGLSSSIKQYDRERWLHDLSWRHWTTKEPLNVGWLLSGYEEAREQAQKGEYDVERTK